MLVFGIAAGVFGWRRSTKHVYRRSVYAPDVPDGISRQEHERNIHRRRERWRSWLPPSMTSRALCWA